MIPLLAAERAAIATQLIAALDRYESDVALLVRKGLDAELAKDLASQFDLMRMYATALPALSVTWVELLISRFDLAHAMWSHRGDGTTHRVAKLHEYHRTVIAEARRKCLGYALAQSSAPSEPRAASRPGNLPDSSRAR